MGWLVFGDNFESSDMTGIAKFQTIKPGSNMILRAVRTWIIHIDDPTFTSLNMKIYSNEVVGGYNTPKKLITTSSDVRTKAEIMTLANGVKEIYFEFNYLPLQGDTLYNFIINGTGYVPTSSSYIAWMKAFPDPIYTTGYTPTMETLPYAPYQLYLIGAEL